MEGVDAPKFKIPCMELHEAVESWWSIQGGRPTPYDRWATLSLVVGPSSLIMSGYVSLWVHFKVGSPYKWAIQSMGCNLPPLRETQASSKGGE